MEPTESIAIPLSALASTCHSNAMRRGVHSLYIFDLYPLTPRPSLSRSRGGSLLCVTKRVNTRPREDAHSLNKPLSDGRRGEAYVALWRMRDKMKRRSEPEDHEKSLYGVDSGF